MQLGSSRFFLKFTPFFASGWLAVLAVGLLTGPQRAAQAQISASSSRQACEAMVLACMPRTACQGAKLAAGSTCRINRCSHVKQLSWGNGHIAEPLMPGEQYASSLSSPFAPDPLNDNWRILDCERPASGQPTAQAATEPRVMSPSAAAPVAPPAQTTLAPAAPTQAGQPAPAPSGEPQTPSEVCGKRVFMAREACFAKICQEERWRPHFECTRRDKGGTAAKE